MGYSAGSCMYKISLFFRSWLRLCVIIGVLCGVGFWGFSSSVALDGIGCGNLGFWGIGFETLGS